MLAASRHKPHHFSVRLAAIPSDPSSRRLPLPKRVFTTMAQNPPGIFSRQY
jgi:hypothetical protein